MSKQAQSHQTRSRIHRGDTVRIAVKINGRYQEELREGIVENILTNSATHHRGIKVRLRDGTVGRVQEIIGSIPGEIQMIVEEFVEKEFAGQNVSVSQKEERRKDLYREYGYEYKTLYERSVGD